MSEGQRLGALLFISGTLLLWYLGAHGLWESTEARYAEIAARMVRSGDWITPRLNGIIHFDKPPLAYWATGLGLALFGVSELGARVGLVAAAMGTLYLVYFSTRRTRGSRAAGYALLCLLSAPLFVALARSVTTDLYLTLWVVLAVVSGHRGAQKGAGRSWRIIAWAAVGAGFLTKGPVMLLWTALPVLVWATWTGEWRRLSPLFDPVGAVVGALIALPWYLQAVLRYPDLLEFWLGQQTVSRTTAAYDGERGPLWFYAPTLIWGLGVWLVPACAELVRETRARIRASGARQIPYVVFWVVVPLVAFTLFPTKRINYILPLLPALAVAAGSWWAAAHERPLAPALSGALGLVTIALGVGLLAGWRIADLPDGLTAIGWQVGPFFVTSGVIVVLASRRHRFGLAFAGTVIPLLALYLVSFRALSSPDVERFFKISRPLAAAAAAHRAPGERIVAVHNWPRAFPFYLNERVTTITTGGRDTRFESDQGWRDYVFTGDSMVSRFFEGPERVMFVVRRRDLPAIRQRLGSDPPILAETRRHALFSNRPD